MGILGEVALGAHRVEAGLILRQSILVSSLLWSAEAWSDVKEKELKRLEQVDSHFLRLLIGGHSKCPTVFLHLETGTLKLGHMLVIKRLLYLKHILSVNDEETIKKVYVKQKEEAVKGDWYKLIESDFKFIGEDFDENSLKMKTKSEFKRWVNVKVRKAAFALYIEEMKGLSKIKTLEYTKLEVQEYLTSAMFNKQERQLLIDLRSKCHQSKENFRKLYKNNIKCRFGCDKDENQRHVFTECDKFKEYDTNSGSYEGIFGNALSKKQTIEGFLKIDQARQQLTLLPGEDNARTHASPRAMQQTSL